MRNCVRFFLFLVGASCTVACANSTAAATIQQLERQLNDALSRVDAVTVDKLWADDFVFVSPSGRVTNKKTRLAGLKPADPNSPALISTLDAVEVRLYGRVAVAIVKTTWRGNIEGKVIADPYIATHVWVRYGSQWRLSSGHVAQIETK